MIQGTTLSPYVFKYNSHNGCKIPLKNKYDQVENIPYVGFKWLLRLFIWKVFYVAIVVELSTIEDEKKKKKKKISTMDVIYKYAD